MIKILIIKHIISKCRIKSSNEKQLAISKYCEWQEIQVHKLLDMGVVSSHQKDIWLNEGLYEVKLVVICM